MSDNAVKQLIESVKEELVPLILETMKDEVQYFFDFEKHPPKKFGMSGTAVAFLEHELEGKYVIFTLPCSCEKLLIIEKEYYELNVRPYDK